MDVLVRDGLERAILMLTKLSDLPANASKAEIRNAIREHDKARKGANVRNLWEGILEIQEVRDIFTGKPVTSKKYDMDHFSPWSFVMNDELWNRMPMDSSLNSSV